MREYSVIRIEPSSIEGFPSDWATIHLSDISETVNRAAIDGWILATMCEYKEDLIITFYREVEKNYWEEILENDRKRKRQQ
jgi:hypothetical protein